MKPHNLILGAALLAIPASFFIGYNLRTDPTPQADQKETQPTPVSAHAADNADKLASVKWESIRKRAMDTASVKLEAKRDQTAVRHLFELTKEGDLLSSPPPAGDQTGYNARLSGITAANQKRQADYDKRIAPAKAIKEKATARINEARKALKNNFRNTAATSITAAEWNAYLASVKTVILPGWKVTLIENTANHTRSLEIKAQ